MKEEKEILFKEVQKFSPWLTIPPIIALAVISLIVAAGLGQQSIQTGRKILWILLAPGLPGLVVLFFILARLETVVYSDALYVRFFPVHIRYRKFTKEQIVSHLDCRYRPLRDFGGWGIRFGKNGKAYNIKGDRGVQLVFKDGGRLLIGSQRQGELALAIGSMAQNN